MLTKVPAFGQLSANSEKAALLILYLGVNAAKRVVVFSKFEPLSFSLKIPPQTHSACGSSAIHPLDCLTETELLVTSQALICHKLTTCLGVLQLVPLWREVILDSLCGPW